MLCLFHVSWLGLGSRLGLQVPSKSEVGHHLAGLIDHPAVDDDNKISARELDRFLCVL